MFTLTQCTFTRLCFSKWKARQVRRVTAHIQCAYGFVAHGCWPTLGRALQYVHALKTPLNRALRLALLLTMAFGIGACGFKNIMEPPSESGSGQKIVKTAYSQMGQRYRYGGDSPQKGFDCSGLIWWTYKKHGIPVPRITSDQAKMGTSVPRAQAKPGDIVVFRTGTSPRGLHTGIYSGNGTFIHSPRRGERVRMESMDIPYWDRTFIGVRRVIP